MTALQPMIRTVRPDSAIPERRLSGDDGVTITELAIVTMLIGFVMATVGGLIAGLLGDWRIQNELTAIQRVTRPVVQQMLIGLREAKPAEPDPLVFPVVELSWDRLVFVSDMFDSDGVPEQIEYALESCSGGSSGGLCELVMRVVPADDPGTAPSFTFTGTPIRDSVLLSGVLADSAMPLFIGVVRTPARVELPACSGSSCDLDLVEINLTQQLDSIPGGETVVLEAVRLRNVPRR